MFESLGKTLDRAGKSGIGVDLPLCHGMPWPWNRHGLPDGAWHRHRF
jgi:hypothetical protein